MQSSTSLISDQINLLISAVVNKNQDITSQLLDSIIASIEKIKNREQLQLFLKLLTSPAPEKKMEHNVLIQCIDTMDTPQIERALTLHTMILLNLLKTDISVYAIILELIRKYADRGTLGVIVANKHKGAVITELLNNFITLFEHGFSEEQCMEQLNLCDDQQSTAGMEIAAKRENAAQLKLYLKVLIKLNADDLSLEQTLAHLNLRNSEEMTLGEIIVTTHSAREIMHYLEFFRSLKGMTAAQVLAHLEQKNSRGESLAAQILAKLTAAERMEYCHWLARLPDITSEQILIHLNQKDRRKQPLSMHILKKCTHPECMTYLNWLSALPGNNTMQILQHLAQKDQDGLPLGLEAVLNITDATERMLYLEWLAALPGITATQILAHFSLNGGYFATLGERIMAQPVDQPIDFFYWLSARPGITKTQILAFVDQKDKNGDALGIRVMARCTKAVRIEYCRWLTTLPGITAEEIIQQFTQSWEGQTFGMLLSNLSHSGSDKQPHLLQLCKLVTSPDLAKLIFAHLEQRNRHEQTLGIQIASLNSETANNQYLNLLIKLVEFGITPLQIIAHFNPKDANGKTIGTLLELKNLILRNIRAETDPIVKLTALLNAAGEGPLRENDPIHKLLAFSTARFSIFTDDVLAQVKTELRNMRTRMKWEVKLPDYKEMEDCLKQTPEELHLMMLQQDINGQSLRDYLYRRVQDYPFLLYKMLQRDLIPQCDFGRFPKMPEVLMKLIMRDEVPVERKREFLLNALDEENPTSISKFMCQERSMPGRLRRRLRDLEAPDRSVDSSTLFSANAAAAREAINPHAPLSPYPGDALQQDTLIGQPIFNPYQYK